VESRSPQILDLWPTARPAICWSGTSAAFDGEADFWAALTGWPRRRSGGSEFDHLAGPDGMPLRLLLQRIDGATAGMHLDLASDDVPAEVVRHVGLGASVVRVTGRWTTCAILRAGNTA
jgi:Glyoxalase-like domain